MPQKTLEPIECFQLFGNNLGKTLALLVWLCPCVQSKVHKDMVWWVWCEGTWLACTEPWPQTYWAPLGRISRFIASQALQPISVPYLTNAVGRLGTNSEETLQNLVESLPRKAVTVVVTKGVQTYALKWDVQQAHICVIDKLNILTWHGGTPNSVGVIRVCFFDWMWICFTKLQWPLRQVFTVTHSTAKKVASELHMNQLYLLTMGWLSVSVSCPDSCDALWAGGYNSKTEWGKKVGNLTLILCNVRGS